MDPLEEVYASALPGKENAFVLGVSIAIQGMENTRFCNGYRDRMLAFDGALGRYKCGDIEIAWPARNTSGQQNLRIGVPNVTGEIRAQILRALDIGEPVRLMVAVYRAGDLTAPVERPFSMEVKGAGLEGVTAVFQGSYKDLLNTAFGDANRYTAETAPGLKYSS